MHVKNYNDDDDYKVCCFINQDDFQINLTHDYGNTEWDPGKVLRTPYYQVSRVDFVGETKREFFKHYLDVILNNLKF